MSKPQPTHRAVLIKAGQWQGGKKWFTVSLENWVYKTTRRCLRFISEETTRFFSPERLIMIAPSDVKRCRGLSVLSNTIPCCDIKLTESGLLSPV